MSNSEWNDREFIRNPQQEQDLEACSIEPDGSAIVWSGEGRPVRIPQEEKEGIGVLMIEGLITVDNVFTMLAAAEETESLTLRSELIDVIEKLMRLIPRPKQDTIETRLTAVRRSGFIRAIAIIFFVAFALYGPDETGSFIPTLDNPDDDDGKVVAIYHPPAHMGKQQLRLA